MISRTCSVPMSVNKEAFTFARLSLNVDPYIKR